MSRPLWTVVVSVGSLVATLAVAPPPAGADRPGAQRRALAVALDQLVADGFPGAVAYGRVDGRRWQVAAGVADRVTGARARPDDRFRIASNTKAFVSTVLLQLVGEGRLTLDDPVERWLPGVVRGNGNDGSTITVRQLLNHTSGIWDPTGERSFWAPYLDDHDWDRVITPRTVIALAVAHRPDFAPGASWGYSNTNYLLAGLIIEAVTGRDAGSEVRRRIVGPLGLTQTSFPVTDPKIHGRHLHGYDLTGRDVTTFSPSYDWTAGAMISTAADLARFHRALFGGQLLAPAQQRELETLVATDGGPDGYGLGVQRMTVPCAAGPTQVWTTDGGGPGFTSIAVTSLDNSRQLVLAGNVYDIDRDVRGLPPVPASAGSLAAMQSVLCTTD
ncbi:D-alanyl-D-alanine carboxypeptidase [Micromonospora luteifusca]|uniref:D-alanyl-D-alanine carboxypeptidase n=1 Tax=Micromonospora luteifusca TaxID=709860 RepID=A0ABS2LWE1_9ACTN|nr:serine hydrolase domain-containing protein [Micromonospora luteifusca]MBM7492506.1 D-alanyl-D-alanine carboxypeptidase [Micromonospora luteifusca]